MPPRSKRYNPDNGHYTVDRILDSKSHILSKDLHFFLVTCIAAWNRTYHEEEKCRIIATLPVAYRLYKFDADGKLMCPVNMEIMDGDQGIKSAVPKFKENVGSGYYEKSWQKSALKAMQERAEGKFDAYLLDQSEEIFGNGPEWINDVGDKQHISSKSDEGGENGCADIEDDYRAISTGWSQLFRGRKL